MAKVETSMDDIPSDIQKHMFKLLATNNGAADFVRATASCKKWKEFAEDADILKTMKFGSTHKFDESFWKKNGFLVKCANADNNSASDIIAFKKMEGKLRRKELIKEIVESIGLSRRWDF